MTDIAITRGEHRYETHVDGHVAHLDFRRRGDVIDAYHTLVPRPIGGRGIAAALVERLVQDARAEGLTIRPSCSYVDVWLRRHPEHADLRA